MNAVSIRDEIVCVCEDFYDTAEAEIARVANRASVLDAKPGNEHVNNQ